MEGALLGVMSFLWSFKQQNPECRKNFETNDPVSSKKWYCAKGEKKGELHTTLV